MLAIAELATTAACTGSSVVLIPGMAPSAGDGAASALDGAIRDVAAADRADVDVDGGAGAGDSTQMSAADARDTADADSNDDGGATADSADDVLNDLICPMAAGHMYVSRTDQPCGQGAPPCRWRVSLALDGTFTWTHDGLVELGTYFCKGTDVTYVYAFWDAGGGIIAFYYPNTGQLDWNSLPYDPVP